MHRRRIIREAFGLFVPFLLLLYRTISADVTGAFTADNSIIDLRAAYAGWLAVMPGMLKPLPHVAVSSPTWPTPYYWLARILALSPDLSSALAWPLIRLQCQNYSFVTLGAARIASAWLGVLSPVWVTLTVISMYFLARRLGGDREARIAAAWWLLAGCQVFRLHIMNFVIVTVWAVDVKPPPIYQQVAPASMVCPIGGSES